MHCYLELNNTADYLDFGAHKYCCELFPFFTIYQRQHILIDPEYSGKP